MVPPELLPPRILAALGLLSSSTACACLSVMEACLSAIPDTGDTGDTSDPEDSGSAELHPAQKSQAVQAALQRADLPTDIAARIQDSKDRSG